MANKNLTVLEENIEEYLYALRVRKDFLNNSRKTETSMGKDG